MSRKLITLTWFCIVLTYVDRTHAYHPPNFNLRPDFIILNSTSRAKFLCVKKVDDQRGFELTLNPKISSDKIVLRNETINSTAIEIELQSLGYIGAFNLICSSVNRSTAGILSDVIIGAPPGIVVREERCIVYHNSYIDCKIRAPVLVAALHNRYQHRLDFTEIRQGSQDSVYNSPPEFVDINQETGTILVRWYPKEKEHFPPGVRMSVHAKMRFFGSSNYTMDMTPNFWIKPNFTVDTLSSTNLKVSLKPWDFTSPVLCQGNVTRDDPSRSRHEGENSKTLIESKQSTFEITGLSSGTWYRVCFLCRLDRSVDSISEIHCSRARTKSMIDLAPQIIIMIGVAALLLLIIGIVGLIVATRKIRLVKQCCCPRNATNTGRTKDDGEGHTIIPLVEAGSSQPVFGVSPFEEPNDHTDTACEYLALYPTTSDTVDPHGRESSWALPILR